MVTVTGTSGDDSLDGFASDDHIDGLAGNDTLLGLGGIDTIFGGDGDDTIFGGDGDDIVDGGIGVDTIDTGNDADTIQLSDNFGNDTITAGEGGVDADTLDASSLSSALDILLTASETGSASDGTSTATFAEVESYVLTAQDDTFNGAAGTTAQTVHAGAGNDTLIGGAGDDVLNGGDGLDSISGGAGSDTINGGAGNDSIDAGDDADTIILNDNFGMDTVSGGEGTTAGGEDNDTLDASANSFPIRIQITGGESGTLTDLATAIDTVSFTGIETFVMTNGNDVFEGIGNFASATVYGGLGNDNIVGGIASDTFYGGEGNDVVIGFAGDDLLFGGDGADFIQGFADDDTMHGEADADIFVLEDGSGSDVIFGGETTTIGGQDNDTIDATANATSATLTFTDAEEGTLTTGTGSASFQGVESFILTNQADTVDGSASTSGMTILANAGDDTILTGSGNDFIDAGVGADTINAGAGADIINAGADQDTIQLTDGYGNDNINAGVNGADEDTLDASTLSAALDILLTGNEAGTATQGGNVATFTEVESFVLTSNDDTFDGSAAATLGATIDAGAGADSITGTGTNDSILGGVGQDTIDGGLGADSISSGDDADTILLNDSFGADTIAGGEGTSSGGTDRDTIDASGMSAGVSVTMTGTEAGTVTNGADTATFTEIENFILTDHNDTFDASAIASSVTVDAGAGNDSIIGSTAADSIIGGDGFDTIDGGAGDDIIQSDDGADSIDGGTGSDTIYAGAGDDSVVGGSDNANDTLFGGTGNDSMFGGGGDDELRGGDNNDYLEGGSGSDSLYGESGNDELLGDAGTDSLYGGSGTDTLFGGSNEDTLFGGTEDDTLFGGTENDALFGDAGADTLFGDDGDDTLTGGDGADFFFGGTGADTFVFNTGDSAQGGDGDDIFNLDILSGGPSDITISGGEGDETGGDTLNVAGQVTNLTYSGGDNEAGTITLTDGSVITFTEIENIVICFTHGTHIMCDRGNRPIQSLSIGDNIVTRDNGLQKIRWIGSRKMPVKDDMAPIVIKEGVLNNIRDLTISPQHRMLYKGEQAELMFGQPEVLIPAKHLLNNDGVYQTLGGTVEYYHILFDRHEIIYAEGTATESYHPGDYSLSEIGNISREEIFQTFPELRSTPNAYGPTARTCLKAHEAQLLRI